jgi:hypothetical protein
MLMGVCNSAVAQVNIGIGLPGVSIGINLGGSPHLVLVPGYPVYYAPELDSNFFFYDGLYWVYVDDRWYSSAWYNGPWNLVVAESVPLYILRVPVGYYRRPPVYFRGWRPDAPPRWGEHWGRDWERRRNGWDRWDHRATPAPAPLPNYQSRDSKDRNPRGDQQRMLRDQNNPYQSHTPPAGQRQRAPEQSAPRDSRNEPIQQNSSQREQRRDQSPYSARRNRPESVERRDQQMQTPQPAPATPTNATTKSQKQHDRSSSRGAREEKQDRGNNRDSDRDR